ncbi:hypothetical protein B0J13DRAFT_503199 [Dactylonectria estremocensis]|uniref:Uncharacterized protein n=1 Tax=Dactylonectria estremocensis TaxID=1079267 RepID=A0A9P9EQU7_9HYPO|nr:hypothetical protein B0J13DRAFT_503199 [Dactylonectria estremocensis]
MASNIVHRVGTPRFYKYQRLIARLYEALIFLWLEQPVQGPHVISNHDNASLTASRRRLTKNLAYICDWDKGGSTTTSIAIEDSENCYMFWVASNQGHEQRATHTNVGVSEFLRTILQRLQDATRESNPSATWLRNQEDACARACTAFASCRIKKEVKILSNMVKKCLDYLGKTIFDHGNLARSEISELKPWLKQFNFQSRESGYHKCMLAYNSRNDPQMNTLRKLSQEVVNDPSAEPIILASGAVRHFVGRLAEHIRISKQLIEDALRVRHVLDVFQVATIEPPTCVSPPEVDSHTNLDGILKRMFRSGDSGMTDFQLALSRMKEHVGIETKIKEQYDKIQAKSPIVHSEMQILEHFHRNKLRFADEDRFVGTSKFACFCCKLYFRHHPLRPVEPDSHEQVYLNWGPIALPDGTYDPLYVEQRDIINPVVKDLGATVLQLLRDKRIPGFRHSNSITGVTQSVDGYDYINSEREENHIFESLTSEEESDSEGGVAL